jgi:hypothetical protein
MQVITIAGPEFRNFDWRKLSAGCVACPFFMPMEKLQNGTWPHPARLPLGCGWGGNCTAPGHEDARLELEDLHSCNLGYADSCRRMPQIRAWDAVRFAVRASALRAVSGSEESAGRIELQYVCERQHRAVEHGTLEFDAVALKWVRPHSDTRVQKMAECFLQVHLERRGGRVTEVA